MYKTMFAITINKKLTCQVLFNSSKKETSLLLLPNRLYIEKGYQLKHCNNKNNYINVANSVYEDYKVNFLEKSKINFFSFFFL